MNAPDEGSDTRIPLSKSQQNIYNGVRHDGDPNLYLIGKSYRFHPLELPGFLAALRATILENPIQLCVLEARSDGDGYPDLVPRLAYSDVVVVRSADEHQGGRGDDELKHTWSAGIFAKPLVRYTVRTDGAGRVSHLDVHTHHILLDGGATGLIEADLARHLSGSGPEVRTVAENLAKLSQAQRSEIARVEQSFERLAAAARRELADESRHGGYGHASNDSFGSAAKAVLHESERVSGETYCAMVALAEQHHVPLNVLVSVAAVAVDARLRRSTDSLLVHAVDNRFGDPSLNVATCLVNSVAHSVSFAPFASVRDVVRTLDRGYVRAVRRRWLREEQYRRMFMALTGTAHVEALTLNFIREPCAPALRPYLSETPVPTDIGPVEGMTVASVLDEDRQLLDIAIWNRADAREAKAGPGFAKQVVAVLEAMPAMWNMPLAMTVGEWIPIGADGSRCRGDAAIRTRPSAAPAWFLAGSVDVDRVLDARRRVAPWVAWLLQAGFAPGDILVFADDNTDSTTDLLIACHLAGGGYSVCDTLDEVPARAAAISEHGGGSSAHVVDVAAARPVDVRTDELRRRVGRRIDEMARDTLLANKIAYIMPTSGSTGTPKLVAISHGSLALFCEAIRNAYGWGPTDTILQCAPLTSDISVEEIFGAAACGSELIRSNATRVGDLEALTHDLVVKRATVLDLPTAVWHLLCEDDAALDTIRSSQLRQLVIGGEAIRSGAVDKWIESGAATTTSLVSTYGPTETTVVVTQLPISCDKPNDGAVARLRLGRPMVPGTVFSAFGEVVVVGDQVAAGYLGVDGRGFGSITGTDGTKLRAFATADRVTFDDAGFPIFLGRKDAVVKIAGKRVDTADVVRRIIEDPAVTDVAVEPHDVGLGNGLGVWFETHRTRAGAEDAEAATRIRLALTGSGVSSFFVVGVRAVPRKPNGKVDSDALREMPALRDATAISADDTGSAAKAAGLAELWSRQLGRTIRTDSSLLDEGIGSLDLIRILPHTRKYLDQHVSILDLISADSAATLVANVAATPTANAWPDADTAVALEHDVVSLRRQAAAPAVVRRPDGVGPIVVLGASGILGTGFAEAVVELKPSGTLPDVVFATRSSLPQRDPWSGLCEVDGVRIERVAPQISPEQLGELIGDLRPRAVVNCIGNTAVLVPYRELRPANVAAAAAIASACAQHGARLVHLSTFVVGAEVAAPRVIDPREAPYPYAASKAVAELAVVAAPRALDFTLARLPRILGNADQMAYSTDILVSLVDACTAVDAYPAVLLTEEVTTGCAAAKGLLGLLTDESAELGRGITVVRGEAVPYAEFLSAYARDELEPSEWKDRLDRSLWASRNPRRWSVLDGWFTLGRILGTRSYAEHVADSATIDLAVTSVAELVATPPPARSLFGGQLEALAGFG